MNILIPDSWLREHLKTKATPKQMKDCLSLCGPSVERVSSVGKEVVYDIEVTTNRVDLMSVRGIAREAAVILPEFGIDATLAPFSAESPKNYRGHTLDLKITFDPTLCYRILAIKIKHITLTESPSWLAKRLELVGQRPLNNIVDITNYVMWETGHPCHVFDFDTFKKKKLIVRLAKKGESLISLDKKKHTMNGGEIVFDNGTGEIIDLPGIMGTANTIVTPSTKNILLFIENSDPVRIRQASMTHAIRTQAAIINEKHPDAELARVTMERAIQLTSELSGGTVASELVDIYPVKQQTKTVTVSKKLIHQYLGTSLDSKRITGILSRLGFSVKRTVHQNEPSYTVAPPSWRGQDITIPEDIIEEVARIYGYHNIGSLIPGGDFKTQQLDPELYWEEQIKVRLRDWGYTEIYPYSMISEPLMEIFRFDKNKTYTITNPLSSDFVYMRPSLLPTILVALEQNLHIKESLEFFELSNIYEWREHNLPLEKPMLTVAVTGKRFRKMKGLAEALLKIFGIEIPYDSKPSKDWWFADGQSLALGTWGSTGIIRTDLLEQVNITKPVTYMELDIAGLVTHAHRQKTFLPIPKYPPVIEDLAFVISDPSFQIGILLHAIPNISPLIQSVSLLDAFENTKTIRIIYQDMHKNLTDEDIKPIRGKILTYAQNTFNIGLKQ